MKTLYAIAKAYSWNCIEFDSQGINIKWDNEDMPDKFMPVFESREKAERLYPNEEIIILNVG